MDNYDVADALGMYAKLSELHNENPFKVKAFAAAAFSLKKVKEPLSGLSSDQLLALPGVGKSVVAVIGNLLSTGQFSDLEQLYEKTPKGVLEMLRIKGLGPKKVQAIWNNMGIESVEELFDACRENRLVEQSGFGLKTQNEVMKAIEFSWGSRGKFHYARIENPATELIEKFRAAGHEFRFEFTGEFRRKCEIIEKVEIITTATENWIHGVAASIGLEGSELIFRDAQGYVFSFLIAAETDFEKAWFESTGSAEHLALLGVAFEKSEAFTYEKTGLAFIIPEMREGKMEFGWAKNENRGHILEFSDLKGSIHNHSTYSDGLHSLAEMAEYCKSLGYEYLGICDHSKSAGYANGLQVERVLQQHQEIDVLNAKMSPFFIFKGIESDILSDGSLDYETDVLKQFDLVVASVHSNLKMAEEVANARLKKAIENPYTQILGHPTGRLLLVRSGYPIDHAYIIDACAANRVAIELNANPYRLDIDWRWIDYAMNKGVMISINPDAHEKHAYHDMYYGTIAGRKGGLTKEMTLNALNLAELKNWLGQKHSHRVGHNS